MKRVLLWIGASQLGMAIVRRIGASMGFGQYRDFCGGIVSRKLLRAPGTPHGQEVRQCCQSIFKSVWAIFP